LLEGLPIQAANREDACPSREDACPRVAPESRSSRVAPPGVTPGIAGSRQRKPIMEDKRGPGVGATRPLAGRRMRVPDRRESRSSRSHPRNRWESPAEADHGRQAWTGSWSHTTPRGKEDACPRSSRESLLQESPQESLGVASGSRSWKTSVDRELEPHDPSREGGCVSPIVGRRLPLLDRRHPGPRSSPPITHVHARRAVVILDRDACPRSPHRPRMDVPECPRRDADPQRSREACLSTIAPHRPPSPHRPRPD